MNIYVAISLISAGVLLLLYIKDKIIYNKKIKRLRELEKSKKEIITALANKEKNLAAIEQLQSIISSKSITVKDLDNQIKQKEYFNSSLKKIREEELDRLIAQEKERKISQLERDLDEWSRSAQEAVSFNIKEEREKYEEQIARTQLELDRITQEIEEYRLKRDSINQEILRERAVNEKQEFYSVQIDDESLHDIELINSIRSKIFKFETLNKLIYDNYISKPAKEMVKRVLNGKNPSGIYKVTNIETKEVYIGKSVNVADRWINHIKSACGLEGVADSQFQRALRRYGIGSFTWELLEEVPKDQLTEREKYYISFFDTTHYGYNMRKG